MKSFLQYITEIFDKPIKAVKPVVRKIKNDWFSDGPTHTTHVYNLTGKQTGGPRGVVRIVRKVNKPSAYVEFEFGGDSSARRKKVLPTKVAIRALGHVMAAIKHHVDTHDVPTTQITYSATSPRRDRMYKMIGKRLGIGMKNEMAREVKGPWGMNRDILERGSRIGSVKKREEYLKRVKAVLKNRGKKSKISKYAAQGLEHYIKHPQHV